MKQHSSSIEYDEVKISEKQQNIKRKIKFCKFPKAMELETTTEKKQASKKKKNIATLLAHEIGIDEPILIRKQGLLPFLR